MKVAFWRATGTDDRWSAQPSLAGLCLEAHVQHTCPDEVEFEFCSSADQLAGSDADVAAISSVTDAWPYALDVIPRCKAKGQYVVVGGRHVTACPESAPSEVDCVITGEGEAGFAALVWARLFEANVPPLYSSPVLDLTDATWLPLAAPGGGDGRLAAVVTRGCPYRCTFCSACRFWGENVRRFTPAYVGEWFRKRKDTFERVGFYDLTFFSDMEWARETVAELKRAGAGTDFEVTMLSARTDIITDELCCLMQSIGVGEIGVGIESGSPRILRKLKPRSSIEAHERALRLCYKHGILVAGSLIFGTPGETDEDLQATYDFLQRWLGKCFRTTGLFLLTPYPGTHWWRWARRRGMIPDPVDWTRFRIATKGHEYELDSCLWLNEAMPRERAGEWRQRVTQVCGQRDLTHVPEAARCG